MILRRQVRIQSLWSARSSLDVALERGRSIEVNTFTVKNNLIELGPNIHETAIATKLDYRRQKFKGISRSVTHLLRAADYARRVQYSLW